MKQNDGMKKVLKRGVFLLALGVFLSPLKAEVSLEIVPGTFDFGWCPDNAQVSAEFRVKNLGQDAIPLTAVQPTCGCTASQFTPGDLASNEETKIGLTFNTRGYAGIKFNKTTKVKAGSPESEYTVILTGYVTSPEAKVVPVGDGIASFEPSSEENKRVISIQNKTTQKVALAIVQKPADWAKVKLKNETVGPGETVEIEVKVEKPYDSSKSTSLTLEALEDKTPHRLTLAIRTGPPPEPLRRVQAPSPVQMKPNSPEPVKPAPLEKPTNEIKK